MNPTSPYRLPAGPEGAATVWETLAPAGEARLVIRGLMISSIDGTIAVGGVSGPLGTPTDHLVYQGMRARADLVVVGAGTAIDEDYGPATVAPEYAGFRPGPAPLVVLLARELRADAIDHCARRGPGGLAIAVTNAPDQAARAAAERAGVRVHVLADAPTGPAIRSLAGDLGAREVVCEGGPGVMGALVTTGGLDELVLSTSPHVVTGSGARTGVVRSGVDAMTGFYVVSAFTADDGGLYTHWVADGIAR